MIAFLKRWIYRYGRIEETQAYGGLEDASTAVSLSEMAAWGQA